MAIWNPWHGCHKLSAGCQNCYVYRRDESVGRDASVVAKTRNFDLPVKRIWQSVYALQPQEGTVFTCMTSDFFLEDADEWRNECWQMIRQREDLQFAIITKRICHEPMLGPIDISKYLAEGQIEYVLCGGESGPDARPCCYDWILAIRQQCIRYGVSFHFKQTGAVFVKDGKTYHIKRQFQLSQAERAGIDYQPAILKGEKQDGYGMD